MKSNSIRIAAVILVCSLAAACVTSGPTGKVSEPDKEEAARLNLDLGITYLQQGKLQDALDKLRKSVEANPQNPSAYRVMGFVYEQLQDPARAEQAYRDAVRQGPDDQQALNALAVYLCVNADDVTEPLRYFDRALNLPEYQNRHEIFTNAGRCAMKRNLELAEQYLRRGLRLRADNPQALYLLADVSFRQAQYLQARAFIERRLASGAAQPDALWLAERIETALGDSVAAQTYRARLLGDFPNSMQAQQALEAQRERG
ncbi:MAG: type IV pilus biogenesis/stability protein PilW [Gammaproteobacteria bacterium]|nr:type IV pilus biogenesis/stability protein PilW [Gammaproteobacteria bacterium]NND54621.1 type IV pilus biogenesis/stability protein PilW [Gammaproteobacteria bacterium]